VTDWRYWITYGGKVSGDTEAEARAAAFKDHVEHLTEPTIVNVPTIELEEEPRLREVEAIDNAGN
jgi:hypothetical protein